MNFRLRFPLQKRLPHVFCQISSVFSVWPDLSSVFHMSDGSILSTLSFRPDYGVDSSCLSFLLLFSTDVLLEISKVFSEQLLLVGLVLLLQRFRALSSRFLPDACRCLLSFIPLSHHRSTEAAAKTYFGFTSFYFSSLVSFSLNSEMWRWFGAICCCRGLGKKEKLKVTNVWMLVAQALCRTSEFLAFCFHMLENNGTILPPSSQ